MPVTSATFIIGWLAIAGVPPLAGFWSKDDILLAAYDKSVALWAVGLVGGLVDVDSVAVAAARLRQQDLASLDMAILGAALAS